MATKHEMILGKFIADLIYRKVMTDHNATKAISEAGKHEKAKG